MPREEGCGLPAVDYVGLHGFGTSVSLLVLSSDLCGSFHPMLGPL